LLVTSKIDRLTKAQAEIPEKLKVFHEELAAQHAVIPVLEVQNFRSIR